MNKNDMTDSELDQLLAKMPKLAVPEAAWDRAMARIAAEQSGKVIAFPAQRKNQAIRAAWWASVPLAASLAFGIYLGAAAENTSLLPQVAYDYLIGGEAESTSGIEEAETLAEEDVT